MHNHNHNWHTLIVDCGGTKADWCLLDERRNTLLFKTEGFNASLCSSSSFSDFFRQHIVRYFSIEYSLKQIFFYGAGCTANVCSKLKQLIQNEIPTAEKITVSSDLLGAARALCGNNAGIAVILGTGSNSCFFDGKHIVSNTPSLGYILGDEGSGSALGRRLLSDVFKGILPEDLRKTFFQQYSLTQEAVIENVYRKGGGNSYMASFVPFLKEYSTHPAIQQLLKEEFERFFERNLHTYHKYNVPISFIGGVACAFREEITSIVEEKGIKLGCFLARPIEGLQQYHQPEQYKYSPALIKR